MWLCGRTALCAAGGALLLLMLLARATLTSVTSPWGGSLQTARIIQILSKAWITVALTLGILVTVHEEIIQGVFRFQQQPKEPLQTQTYDNGNNAISKNITNAGYNEIKESENEPECSIAGNVSIGKFSFRSQVTPEFLNDYKNPCWRPEGSAKLLCVPYAFLAGFPKCGTTDLFKRIIKHPHVIQGKTKECHYITRHVYKYGSEWCTQQNARNANTSCEILTYAKYCFSNFARVLSQPSSTQSTSLTSHIPPQITVDASASTAWDNTEWVNLFAARNCSEVVAVVPSLVKRINPKARIIFILRDPVERTLSDFIYFGKNNSMEALHELTVDYIRNFDNCLQEGKSIKTCTYLKQDRYGCGRLSVSIYHVYIKDWLDTFPRNQFYILRTEDYHSNMEGHIKNIFSFLDLADLESGNMTTITDQKQKANVNKRKENVSMSPSTRRLLEDFFRPHNERLAALLGDQTMTWHYTKRETRR